MAQRTSNRDVRLFSELLIRAVDAGLGRRELKALLFLAGRSFTGHGRMGPGGVGKLATAIGCDKSNTRAVLEALAKRRLLKIIVQPDGWEIEVTDWRHIGNALDGKPIEESVVSVAVPGGGVAESTIDAAKKARPAEDEKPPLPTHQPFYFLSWEFREARLSNMGDAFYRCYDGRNLRHCKDILTNKAGGDMAEAQRRLWNLVAWSLRPGETFLTITPACLLSQWDRLFSPPPSTEEAGSRHVELT
jgi:hypothetical protein